MNNNHNNENENENENKNVIKELHDDLDEIIDKTKSFGKQIKLLKTVENLEEDYYYYIEYCDDKELKLKIFKINLAQVSNIIDEELFPKNIWLHTWNVSK